jgi:DNA-binding transcriptional LysR family regulator
LQRFEARLGTPLFRRTTWAVCLREDGETYLEAARAALRRLNEAEVALAVRGDELVGLVRVVSRSVHKT